MSAYVCCKYMGVYWTFLALGLSLECRKIKVNDGGCFPQKMYMYHFFENWKCFSSYKAILLVKRSRNNSLKLMCSHGIANRSFLLKGTTCSHYLSKKDILEKSWARQKVLFCKLCTNRHVIFIKGFYNIFFQLRRLLTHCSKKVQCEHFNTIRGMFVWGNSSW